MDPLSISASVLTVIAAAITTVKALSETVERYRGRDKVLGRLQDGLKDLSNILESLKEVADDETPVLVLLKGPVGRCAQVAGEFEEAMKVFNTDSKMSLKDWTRMEFMRGDINEFTDTLAGYKSTIMIGLGIINMQTSRVTQQVVTDYNEMVQDTSYNLGVRLQRIEDRMISLAASHPPPLTDSNIDLQDEKAVTLQCLRICERAGSYIQSLQDEQPTLQREEPQQNAGYLLKQFEAQLMTHKTLSETQDSLVELIGRLRERLNSVTSNGSADRESEVARLQEEIKMTKQCLELCETASDQASSKKIHIIGEVVAEEDCDQVVVTAVADLFNVGSVRAKNRSMQLVGSMPPETLGQMSKDRYASRYGALGSSLAGAQADRAAVSPSPSAFESAKADSSASRSNRAREEGNSARSEPAPGRPASNEVRKRRAGGEDGNK